MQRKFTILYNYILDTLQDHFLIKFYSVYIHKFFFEQRQLVIDTVFKPLGFDQEKSDFIYSNVNYGFSSVDTFQHWVRLSLKGENYAVTTPEYQSLMTELSLSQK